MPVTKKDALTVKRTSDGLEFTILGKNKILFTAPTWGEKTPERIADELSTILFRQYVGVIDKDSTRELILETLKE